MSNLYRPQFAFRTPPGFRDETFHYSFDSTNVNALGNAITAGNFIADIVLPLQNDAEFICRGIKVQGTDAGGTVVNNLEVWIKDPFGNYLSQVYMPLGTYLTGAGAAIVGRMIVPIEPERVCPAGSTFTVYLNNPTLVSILPPKFTFFGVKRYPLCERAA